MPYLCFRCNPAGVRPYSEVGAISFCPHKDMRKARIAFDCPGCGRRKSLDYSLCLPDTTDVGETINRLTNYESALLRAWSGNELR